MNVPKLRFNGFNEEWKSIEIGEVGEIITGSTPDTTKRAYYDGKKLFVSPADFNFGRFICETKTTLTEKGFSQGRRVEANSVLFVCIGSTIGKVAQNSHECVTNQQINSIVVKSTYSNGFIYSRLEKDSSKISLLAGKQAVPIINKTTFAKVKISVPTLPEQTKIANFLAAVDEKIQLLTQKSDLLAQYKKGVMQKIFSQELRFKDDDGREFPEWEEKTLNEVCECLDNKRKPLNDEERQAMQGEIPYWGANNIMDYVNDYIFNETIVLLAEDGGNFNEYKTRPIANISHGKCWVNNHTHVLKGKTGLSNEFLFYSLVHKNITGYVSGGTRAKLTKGEMLKIVIDVPSTKEQTKIANFLTVIDDKITQTQAELDAVKQYKQGLLQQMFV